MESPGRKRPRSRRLAVDLDPADLASCAAKVLYTGSPEHKSYPSFAGPPKLRSSATPCPKEFNDQETLTNLLKDAIIAGQVSSAPEGEFPRYVWIYYEDRWFEAMVTNITQGWYKGYQIRDDQAPKGVRER